MYATIALHGHSPPGAKKGGKRSRNEHIRLKYCRCPYVVFGGEGELGQTPEIGRVPADPLVYPLLSIRQFIRGPHSLTIRIKPLNFNVVFSVTAMW